MRIKFNHGTRCILLITVLTCLAPLVRAQSIFAHNDYLKPQPLKKAMELRAAYIEADIFLENGALLVAHTRKELDPAKTLERMYLEPLSHSEVYELNLMIDLKTGGAETMNALIKLLEKMNFTSDRLVHVVLSGNYPPPSEWKSYPAYIWFDGRPNVSYTKEQQDRIKLISTSFSSVSNWDGNGEIPAKDLEKIEKVVDEAHKLDKPVRFWASPDFENAWLKLTEAGVDVLNSDNIEPLSKFIPTLRSASQRSR